MCPFGNKPDCFSCPLPDCTANTKQLSRQEKVTNEKKLNNKEQAILADYKNGVSTDAIYMRYNINISQLKRILGKAGIDYKKNKRISVQ